MTIKTQPKRRRVIFSINAEPGSKVFLAGSFNNWNLTKKPLTDKSGDGSFRATLLLEPGSYEYKFIINGIWCVDPECSDWRSNEMGSLNSVVNVS